jgi:thymidylate kinase
MNEGKWVVFEGPDGTGKDTIISKLQADLSAQNKNFITVKDPSPKVAAKIREILLSEDRLENNTRLFLYLAARCELLNKEILPALREGKIVLCNRYVLSTYCYQGIYFSKEDIDLASHIGRLDIVKPDLQIVYLAQQSLRDSSLEDVMGRYCRNHRQQILKRYLDYAKDPDLNILTIWVDGKTVEEVYLETWQCLRQIL